jgi:hypothetical protein
MPTVIGIIFLAASVFCFFLGDDELFALLIFSSIFQSSSVIALKDAGVTPYYLVGAVFVLQGIYRYARGGKERAKQASFKGKWWMVAFGVIAIVSAFTLPFVFAGIPVYEQHIGIDDGFFLRPPLQFRNANISHSVSLLLGVLIVLGAAKRVRNGVLTGRAYLFTFYVLAGVITVQFLCLLLGIEFPYALLQNNAGGSMQMVDTRDFASRFPGTFTESSAAGQVLVCFTAGFLAERLKVGRSLIPVGVGLAAIMLVRSSTAIVAIAVVIGLLCLWHPIFRFPFYINLVRLRRVALLLVLGALVHHGDTSKAGVRLIRQPTGFRRLCIKPFCYDKRHRGWNGEQSPFESDYLSSEHRRMGGTDRISIGLFQALVQRGSKSS